MDDYHQFEILFRDYGKIMRHYGIQSISVVDEINFSNAWTNAMSIILIQYF